LYAAHPSRPLVTGACASSVHSRRADLHVAPGLLEARAAIKGVLFARLAIELGAVDRLKIVADEVQLQSRSVCALNEQRTGT